MRPEEAGVMGERRQDCGPRGRSDGCRGPGLRPEGMGQRIKGGQG